MAGLKCDSKCDCESWLVIRMTLFFLVFMIQLESNGTFGGFEGYAALGTRRDLCDKLVNHPEATANEIVGDAMKFIVHEWYEQQGYGSPYTLTITGPFQVLSYGYGFNSKKRINMTSERIEQEKRFNSTFNGMHHALRTLNT